MNEAIINQVLIPVLATILTGVFSYIGMRIKSIYEEKVDTEVKKQIVNATVQYVEQVYSKLKGEEKLKKAIETASAWLNDKGIYVSEAELTILLEAAVNGFTTEFEMNKEFKDGKSCKTLKEGE